MTDLQRHPRLSTRIAVEVTNQSGVSTRTWIRNLSPGGVMIDGDGAFKTLVCGEQALDPLYRPIEIRIHCLLPGEALPLTTRCRLVYVRRLSQHAFNLGFRFVDLDGRQASLLDRYVHHQLNGGPAGLVLRSTGSPPAK